MPKQKIAIISVLKPVDDIRSYEKMAKALAENSNNEIHLFGYPSNELPSASENILFHPHKRFSPLSLSRLLIGIKILIELIKLKPKVVIANTHELLNVITLYKILFGSKICYDIQENYYRNLRYQTNYNWFVKYVGSHLVRITETLLSPFINHFFLAEKCYQDELKFLSSRYTILENKALEIQYNEHKQNNKSPTTLLFSGTISESNGIFKAIEIFHAYKKVNAEAKLRIVGHCPNASIVAYLHQLDRTDFVLNIDSSPLPYAKILEAISTSDIGIVSYQINPSNQNCMPTKVFEYCAYGLPMLYEEGAYWSAFIKQKRIMAGAQFQSLRIN